MNNYPVNVEDIFKKDKIEENKNIVDSIAEEEYYKTIKTVVDGFVKSPLFKTFSNNCIAACDMIQASLNLKGIRSRLIEVQLSMMRTKGEENSYMFIGFDNIISTGQVDTHMVVVTDTKIPLLIDLSLGKYLPSEAPFILRPILPTDEVIAEFEHFNIKLSYSYKKNIRFPQIHQKYLIQRMQEEQEVRKEISFIRIMVMCALAMSGINFVLNAILIILKTLYL
jgi:hypothetical protein